MLELIVGGIIGYLIATVRHKSPDTPTLVERIKDDIRKEDKKP